MSESPQWDRLPHDPVGFFELDDGFSLRDLKRSYNRLIRRFKPEKCPQEFQRIRAAYESLNDALRYNVPTERPGSRSPFEADSYPQPDRFDESSPAAEHSEDSSSQPETTRSVSRRGDVERQQPANMAASPEETYEQLRALETKSPDAYFKLAVLSDIVHDRRAVAGESFADWLLAGLAAHRGDWGLMQLWREYLGEPHDVTELASLLQRSVEVLPADRFQYVTEPAWDRLMREAPFENFRDCLQKCGQRLGRAVDHSQLVFYVHILKFAIWKADGEFLNDILATVEDHFYDLDRWAQEEYELACTLMEYIDRRDAFVAHGPCAARIDRAIRDWCVLDESAGDMSVLDCQYFLNSKGRKLLDEFTDLTVDYSFVLLPWDRITADVLDRLEEPPPVENATAAVHARDLMIRNTTRRSRTLSSNLGYLQMMVAMATLIIAVSASIAFIVRMCFFLGDVQILAAIFDFGLAVAMLLFGVIIALFTFYRGVAATKIVYKTVRPDLLKLFRAAPLPAREMANVIAARERETYGDGETISDTNFVVKGLLRDPALDLFATAQICLRAADPEPADEPLVIR